MPDSAGYYCPSSSSSSLSPRMNQHQQGGGGGSRSFASTPSLRSRDPNVLPLLAKKNAGANVKVVVRVRAFLPREIKRNAECLIEMDPESQTTTLHPPSSSSSTTTSTSSSERKSRKILLSKSFTFDQNYYSKHLYSLQWTTLEHINNSRGE
ncbi:uncharacterized protein PODANS_2_3445 [Podospora anserina S mat+]|uniref:Podospora anserina S mat+ genomic DNA chromosome 2, supercontig 2 n=1 Tax=Podospora anserina (strain S / ATCC MYA-4624 / DSM 980 / FGSC 10383) TaxID=515849 RepID=B2B544_PODAN|nr:uncharacterized protein PODANS_2_3445 [Podospora anserina S mat+]CAP72919.1 unnamed protein product [Podospora anserina S mat+]